jgi:hypothetical protein
VKNNLTEAFDRFNGIVWNNTVIKRHDKDWPCQTEKINQDCRNQNLRINIRIA